MAHVSSSDSDELDFGPSHIAQNSPAGHNKYTTSYHGALQFTRSVSLPRELCKPQEKGDETFWIFDSPSEYNLECAILISYLVPEYKKEDANIEIFMKCYEHIKREDDKYINCLIISSLEGHRKSTEFSRRLMRVTGSDKNLQEFIAANLIEEKPTYEDIEKTLTNFNPFTDDFIEELAFWQDLRKCFSDRLSTFVKKIQNNSKGFSVLETRIKAACCMLNCSIDIYSEDQLGKMQSRRFLPDEVTEVISLITLFEERDSKGKSSFNYGFGSERCWYWRMQTLAKLLNMIHLSSLQIAQLMTYVECDLLIWRIASSPHKHVLQELFQNPFVIKSLVKINFDLDPCSIGPDGLSCFYHCMSDENTRIMCTLYNSAATNFYLTRPNVRNSVYEDLESLKRIGKAVESDLLVSNGFQSLKTRRGAANKTCAQLLKFNKYQCKVVEQIFSLDQTNRKSSKSVIAILQNYKKSFMYNTTFSEEYFLKQHFSEKFDLFEHYVEYSDFHEHLDDFTCLMLCDRFSQMRYSDTTAKIYKNIYLTFLANKFFPKCKTSGLFCNDCKNCLIDAKHCATRFVPFCYRRFFLENIDELLDELNLDPDSKGRFLCFEDIRESFISEPDVFVEFITKRLLWYFQATIKLESKTIEENPLNCLLVIERTLQVFGECINDKSTTSSLIRACLPSEIIESCIKIRHHCFSHYRTSSVQGRLNLHKNVSLIKQIQLELKIIYDNVIIPVFVIQLYRIEEHLLMNCKKELKKTDYNKFHSFEEELKKIGCMRKDQFEEFKEKFTTLFKAILVKFTDVHNKKETVSETVKNCFTSLNLLLQFLVKHCEYDHALELEEASRLISVMDDTKLIGNFTEMIEIVLILIEIVLKDIFSANPENVAVMELTDFPNLQTLLSVIKDYDLLEADDKSEILEKCNHLASISSESFKLLSNILDRRNKNARIDEFHLKNVVWSEKIRKQIEKYSYSNPETAKEILKCAAEKTNKELQLNKELLPSELGEKLRNCGVKYRLMKATFTSRVENKISILLNQKLIFLINRTRVLKAILIDSDVEIKRFWDSQKLTNVKEHTKYLMINRYWKDIDFRIALEMLLFDCMNALDGREDLKHLWNKVDNIFAGVNLRHVLSHGNPVIETVGGILEPSDLPSELIEKMLQLVEDLPALETLYQIWKDVKPLDIKEIETALEARAKDKTECKRWKKYVNLLPFFENYASSESPNNA